MAADPSLYSILGLDHSANPKQIRNAYLNLLVSAHPDKGGDSERFQAIQHAYAVLSDPYERSVYDEKLQIKLRNTTARDFPVLSSSNLEGAKGRKVIIKNGVKVVVHGQTLEPPQFAAQVPAATAATAGVTLARSYRDEEEDSSLQRISSEISEMLIQLQAAHREMLGDGAALLREMQQKLANLHIQRAQLYIQQRRLHHAAFDAQEALDLCPEDTTALNTLEKVLKFEEEAAIASVARQQQTTMLPAGEDWEHISGYSV